MMAVACVLVTLSSVYLQIEIAEYVQRVIDGIIGAYIGSRLPSLLREPAKTETPEVEHFSISSRE